MTQALIAFGANLGDAQASLDEAADRIAGHAEIDLVAVASPLVTKAVSGEEGDGQGSSEPVPDYLNSAIRIETSLKADALFQLTVGLENEMGRQRRQRWGPRTIDLDIILFGDQVIDDPKLQVPHPRMSFRRFVIDPAADIAGELIDPVSGARLDVLADRLRHSPKTILWIAGDSESAQVEAAQATEGSNSGGWGFSIVTSIEEVEAPLKDFRLMLFSDRQQSFEDAALRFAGPWLNLARLPDTQRPREIRAAIQAMT